MPSDNQWICKSVHYIVQGCGGICRYFWSATRQYPYIIIADKRDVLHIAHSFLSQEVWNEEGDDDGYVGMGAEVRTFRLGRYWLWVVDVRAELYSVWRGVRFLQYIRSIVRG